jgi:hypothetical protein
VQRLATSITLDDETREGVRDTMVVDPRRPRHHRHYRRIVNSLLISRALTAADQDIQRTRISIVPHEARLAITVVSPTILNVVVAKSHSAKQKLATRAVFDEDEVVNAVETESMIRVDVLVAGKPIKLLLDTGSRRSLINYYTYPVLFADHDLKPTSVDLHGYANTSIDVLGELEMAVTYESHAVDKTVFIVIRQGSNIMGRTLMKQLSFTIMHDETIEAAVEDTAQLSEHILHEFPSLTQSSLRPIKGFVHQPMVDRSIKPVRQPLHRVPLALQEQVEKELRILADNKIIQATDSAEWL